MKVLTSILANLALTALSVLMFGQGISLHESLRSIGLPPGALPIMGLCMIAIANTRKQSQTQF